MKFSKGTIVRLSNSEILLYLGNKLWMYPSGRVRYRHFITGALEKHLSMYNAKLL